MGIRWSKFNVHRTTTNFGWGSINDGSGCQTNIEDSWWPIRIPKTLTTTTPTGGFFFTTLWQPIFDWPVSAGGCFFFSEWGISARSKNPSFSIQSANQSDQRPRPHPAVFGDTAGPRTSKKFKHYCILMCKRTSPKNTNTNSIQHFTHD